MTDVLLGGLLLVLFLSLAWIVWAIVGSRQMDREDEERMKRHIAELDEQAELRKRLGKE